MQKPSSLTLEYTDDIKIFLNAYTNKDWKEHAYVYGVSNFISRIINYIPDLITNPEFTIKIVDIVATIQELIIMDSYGEYETYIVRMIMEDIKAKHNEGYAYNDMLSLEQYEYLLNLYKTIGSKKEMFNILFQDQYLHVVMNNHVFKTIANTMLNSISIYSKYYPILYDITSNPNYFFLIERLDTEGCLVTFHMDPNVQR